MQARTDWDGFAWGGPDTGRKGGWIQTFTGRQFWPLDALPEDIDLRDIAHHLSMQARFSGATSRHYSVAEHCVRVALELEDTGASWEVRLWGLLHDAAEAYLVDLPRPIKHSDGFAAYCAAEARLSVVICEWAGLDVAVMDDIAVEHADRVLLATERRDLLGPDCHWEVPGVRPLTKPLPTQDQHYWYWERQYIRTFRRLHDLTVVSQRSFLSSMGVGDTHHD